MPVPHITEVTPLPGYRLALRFNTGESGIVDLSGELAGEVFASRKDPARFASAYQHPVMGTVAWEGGADLAPEFLMDLLHEQADDDERALWAGLSLSGLAGAYGEGEPDYGPDDVGHQ